MHVLLPKVLQNMSVCTSWNLWKQKCLLMLQQLEDQGRKTKMSLNISFITSFPFHLINKLLAINLRLMGRPINFTFLISSPLIFLSIFFPSGKLCSPQVGRRFFVLACCHHMEILSYFCIWICWDAHSSEKLFN